MHVWHKLIATARLEGQTSSTSSIQYLCTHHLTFSLNIVFHNDRGVIRGSGCLIRYRYVKSIHFYSREQDPDDDNLKYAKLNLPIGA